MPPRNLMACLVIAMLVGLSFNVGQAKADTAADAPKTVTVDGHDWYVLFNGRDLDGWRPSENPDVYSIEDGKIILHGPRSHLFYEGPVANADFDDFHFRAEVYTYPQANSGIFFHTQWQAGGWPGVGYEAQVNATQSDRIKTGSIYNVAHILDNAPHKDREWFLYEIIVDGDTVTLRVDDETVLKYTEKQDDIQGSRRLSSGTFALQAHDPNSRMYYRNIYVRPLEGDSFAIAEPPVELDAGLKNVIKPGNSVTAIPSGNTPDGEGVEHAIDGNAGTKYLNFEGANKPSGFEVVLDGAAVVTALRLTSANDAPDRDPAAYLIEGADSDGAWTEIASGTIDRFRGRHAVQAFTFDNAQAYERYRVVFPKVQNPDSANSMQIANVELLSKSDE
ncbi:MAG: family 16 glycoside hydrolase [Phycisphaeraceae bacterium]